MSKLLSIVTASMFAFATTGVLAQSTTTKPMVSDPKVDCKDVKNKDNAACKTADSKAATKSEMKSETKTEKKTSDKEDKKQN